MVARVWQKQGVQPHRIEPYMASNDPDFEKKAADIIGLLNPPAQAAVFSVDEKCTIQARDRKDPVLPLSPGRAERHGFEYFRHGTLSLYAAFNTKTGEVLGKTAARHTSRGVFTSVSDLKRKLLRYIRQYNKSPRTVKWKYADPSRHISTQSVGTATRKSRRRLARGQDSN
jgi:hypothetical protein